MSGWIIFSIVAAVAVATVLVGNWLLYRFFEIPPE